MMPPKFQFRLNTEWWLVGLLLSALVIWLTVDRATMRIDNLIYDQMVQIDSRPQSQHILLVAIDGESLQRVGRWPWPRQMHVRLIDQLNKAAPAAIAYDVLFTEPGPAEGDKQLGAAIARAKHLFVPLAFVSPGQNGAAFDPTQPIPAVQHAASGVGHVNLRVDADGAVRRAELSFGDEKHRWPHLMELVRRSVQKTPSVIAQEPMLIPFTGPTGHWPTVSAASVLNGEVPDELLRGRLILVGATAQALGDRYSVPTGELMPGVEIQAHILNGLLTNRMVGLAGTFGLIGFGLAPLWLLLLAYRALPRWAALLCVGSSIMLVMLTVGVAFYFFRIWLPPAAVLAGLCVSYPLWAWRQLAAADAFVTTELRRFDAEPALLPQEKRSTAVQLNATELLTQAIAQARNMRQFVLDRLNQLPDATLVADMGGQIILANVAAAALFDALDVSVADRRQLATLLTLFRDNATREPLEPAETDSAGHLSFNQSDREVVTRDGRFYALRFASQRSATGALVGWVARIMDVSEGKAAQRQREDILQLLTHDMRSPQASILAVLETAMPTEIADPIADRIRHYARRTLSLADGFVELARAEMLDYVVEEVDFADMLMDAIDDLWPQLTAKNITIETKAEDHGLIVVGERSLLTRALGNVIGNAVKYSDRDTRIVCTLARAVGSDGKELVSCAIADEGPGFAPEHRRAIFKRFHRGPMGVGRKVDGVGLGLSFVHTVMMRHKGEIQCVSEPGCGSTFTFMLPLIA